ncbi:MAG: 4-(cytidine 5'-diphospho)-2-C-methyl-D-erythritol kinase [Methylobacteriaceae bacterium]|nr:4-(cytidine 5'-diphospho)-2-C-methyl-D-erythritol kinase [Methylobacteriaceae bacterium]
MSAAPLRARAPAKLNLSLRVLRRRDDGRHDLDSLVAFAGTGDGLTLTPAGELALTVEGPFAAAAGPDQDNLVLRAARALAARVPGLTLGRFHLIKRLPAAAGLGGGSADAAAALRLLARANRLAEDDPRLVAAARETGADVPVCLAARARRMGGTGDELGPPLALPPLFAVLVNPGVALSTAAVFARMGLSPGEDNVAAPPLRWEGGDAASLFAALNRTGNDMEAAACVLAPVVGDALAVLGAARGARLSRMSGSGATCFALFETCRRAGAAAKAIRRDHPGWWVKATTLR